MTDSNPTRTNFHLALQDGDPVAWEEFYLIYFDMMVFWAKEFGFTEAEANELAQAKAIQLFLKDRFTSFKSRGAYSFRRWLKRVVANEVFCQFRKIRRQTSTETMGGCELEEIAQSACAPPFDGDWSDGDWSFYRRSLVNRALRASIAQRPTKESSIFIRRIIRKESAADVCADLEMGRATFDVYLGRFRERLSLELKRLISDEQNYLGTIEEVFDEGELLEYLRDIDAQESQTFDTLLETSVCPASRQTQDVQSMLHVLDKTPAPDLAQACILAIGPTDRKWYVLHDGLSIGREDGNDIILEGDGVSSFHASIHRSGEGWLVRDEKSTNHVFLNHQMVNGEAVLIPGDWFQISAWSLIYTGASGDWGE